MASQDAEFVLPISLLKSMNDLPQNLEPLENFPNIFKFDINNQQYMLKTYPIDNLELREKLLKLSQFFNEAAIQSSIPHPNILHIYGIVLTDNNVLRPGIITRTCSHNDLRKFIADNKASKSKKIDGTTKTFFSLMIIDAISELHERNLIHGDIKPDNIFIDSDEKLVYTPLLADFGSSRLMSEYNIITGTKFYQAPETIICQKNEEDSDLEVGKPSDIFSFGMTLLNMEKDETDSSKVFGFSNNLDNEKILKAYERIPEVLNKKEPINEAIVKCCSMQPESRPIAKNIFETIKNGQFFSGTDKNKLYKMLNIEEERKKKLAEDIKVENVVSRYSTLAEFNDMITSFPTMTPIQFVVVLVHLLGLISFDDMDDISKSIINNYKARKIKDTGLQILDLAYNIFKNVSRFDQYQLFISIAHSTLSMANNLSTMQPEICPKNPGDLRKTKSKPVIIRSNSRRTQTTFGPITIQNQSYESSVFKFEIVSEKPVPFKIIKIRKSDMTIAFTF